MEGSSDSSANIVIPTPTDALESHHVAGGEGYSADINAHELSEMPLAQSAAGVASHANSHSIYKIDCIDIAKDGNFELVNDPHKDPLAETDEPKSAFSKRRVFHEEDYERLVDNAPEGKLRILSITNVNEPDPEESQQARASKRPEDFAEFQPFNLNVPLKPEDAFGKLWQPDDLGQFRCFLRYQPYI